MASTVGSINSDITHRQIVVEKNHKSRKLAEAKSSRNLKPIHIVNEIILKLQQVNLESPIEKIKFVLHELGRYKNSNRHRMSRDHVLDIKEELFKIIFKSELSKNTALEINEKIKVALLQFEQIKGMFGEFLIKDLKAVLVTQILTHSGYKHDPNKIKDDNRSLVEIFNGKKRLIVKIDAREVSLKKELDGWYQLNTGSSVRAVLDKFNSVEAAHCGVLIMPNLGPDLAAEMPYLEPNEFLGYLRELIGTMYELAQEGQMLADVKPNNLTIYEETLRIIDVNLEKINEPMEVCTPMYQSPKSRKARKAGEAVENFPDRYVWMIATIVLEYLEVCLTEDVFLAAKLNRKPVSDDIKAMLSLRQQRQISDMPKSARELKTQINQHLDSISYDAIEEEECESLQNILDDLGRFVLLHIHHYDGLTNKEEEDTYLQNSKLYLQLIDLLRGMFKPTNARLTFNDVMRCLHGEEAVDQHDNPEETPERPNNSFSSINLEGVKQSLFNECLEPEEASEPAPETLLEKENVPNEAIMTLAVEKNQRKRTVLGPVN